MKTKFIYGGVLILATIIFLLLKFCGNTETKNENKFVEEKKTKYINPPFANIEVPQEIFDVDASKGGVLNYGTTTITVPDCAFMDKDSNIVKGNVKLAYREVNDPVEIMISGIPMEDVEGSGQYLESAGMFEMLAWNENGNLFVNPDCLIKVKLQSEFPGSDYNRYNLDTTKRRWIENLKNLAVEKIEQKVKDIKPKRNKSMIPENFSFNFFFKEPDYEKLAADEGILNPVKPLEKNKDLFQFKFKMDFTQYPELNIYNGVQWEFVGNKNSEDPEKNPWVKSAYWNEMEIVKRKSNGVYILKLKSGDKTFRTTVKPVFDSEDMEYAEYVFQEKYEKYKDFVDKKKEEARLWRLEQERIAREKAQQEKVDNISNQFSREIGVVGFGWCNIDRIIKLDRQEILAFFVDLRGKKLKVNRAYLMIDSVNSVVTYLKDNFNKFSFIRNRKNTMVVIDSLANVYVVEDNIFDGISKDRKDYEFKLNQPSKVESEADIRKLLRKI